MVRALAALVALAACQGSSSSSSSSSSSTGSGAGTAAVGRDAAAGSAVIRADAAIAAGEPDARAKPDEPEGVDPSRVIAELNAIPAWQAVIDRADLLGRRGQHGVVYGRVGPPVMVPAPPATVAPPATPPAPGASPAAAPGLPASAAPRDAGVSDAIATSPSAPRDAGVSDAIATSPSAPRDAGPSAPRDAGPVDAAASAPAAAGSKPAAAPPALATAPALVASPYVWLIDDTEGNGALAIRIALAGKAKLGDRIAAGGAWQLDGDRRWYWKPDAIQPLAPAPASELKEPQPAVPSHAIANGELPSGSRTISVARDGDAAYFQIVGPVPAADGDGWLIADQLGSPTAALLNLPGERASYGGQDMRAADERWQLKRGQTYWVRIGKLRKRGADKPPLVNARTAPIRVL